MKPNKLREKLNAGVSSLGTHVHATWPSVVELVGHTGEYDYVEFVGEYAPFDLHDLDNLARAAELYEMGSMIKVDAENRAYVAQRAVGSGFGSVLFADVRDADDARRFLDMGVRHFCIGTDVTVLYGYWRDEGEAMRRALEEN